MDQPHQDCQLLRNNENKKSNHYNHGIHAKLCLRWSVFHCYHYFSPPLPPPTVRYPSPETLPSSSDLIYKVCSISPPVKI